MSTKKKPSRNTRTSKGAASFVADAKALYDRFPSLKKYIRRKTLNSYEKGAITRARNRALARDFPKKKRTTAYYHRLVKALLKTKGPLARSLRQYKRAKILLPGQKAYISKVARKLRYTDNIFALTEQEKNRLPKLAKAGLIPYLRAMKFRDTLDDAKLEVDDTGVVIIKSGSSEWFYHATGEDPDALAGAAQAAFDNDAKQVNIWTVHGRVSGGSGNMQNFLTQLSERYMKYLEHNVADGPFAPGESQDWLLGIATTYG